MEYLIKSQVAQLSPVQVAANYPDPGKVDLLRMKGHFASFYFEK